jgi:pimeloyl-ACP methyl ester carboxylesterase
MSHGVWRDDSGPVDGGLILVIHGSMDRSSGMLRLGRTLDREFRVVRYDRRGYGRSKPHDGPFDMTAQVGDAVDVLEGRRAIVFGHSYGGNVALAMAATHPHLVAAVGVYETPLSWEPWWPGTTAGAAAIATQGEPEEAAERFMRRLIGDERWEGLHERTRSERRSEGVAMVGELSDLRSHRPWVAADVRVPVIAGYGELGRPHHRDGMQRLGETLTDARAVQLAGCRHDAPMSHPALIRTHIVEPLVAAVEAW